MNRKAMFVIRIGVSIENANDVPLTISIQPEVTQRRAQPDEGTTSQSNGRHPTSTRSQEDNANPRAATPPRNDSMTDTQRKALFRLAFALGDRDSALNRILEVLGVEKLELATKVQASKAITFLEAQRGHSARRSTGCQS